jgi:16S rRNA (guanine966-N2)-methyltransferase
VRIIGGALRGRRLRAPAGTATRPTTDRVREAIASALESRGLIQDAVVLDLFAGTGALGLEAISRGAARAALVDQDRRAVEALRGNCADLAVSDRVRAVELDLLGPAAEVEATLRSHGSPFTLAFADAPYALLPESVELLGRLASSGVLEEGCAVVVEHAQRSRVERPACFNLLAAYRYGDSGVVLWETIACDGET